MRLAFTVGETEQHDVEFTWDQMWGWLTISVDGEQIVRKLVTLSFKLRDQYDFQVGKAERHGVRIVKQRPLFVAGYRPQPVRAWVDGELVAESTENAIASSHRHSDPSWRGRSPLSPRSWPFWGFLIGLLVVFGGMVASQLTGGLSLIWVPSLGVVLVFAVLVIGILAARPPKTASRRDTDPSQADGPSM